MRCGLLLILSGAFVACSSFSSTDDTGDGGAAEGGLDGATLGDASASDAPQGDTAPASDAADGGDRPCTTFGADPATVAGWSVVAPTTGATLAPVSRHGRMALAASVQAINQSATLVHDLHPGPGGVFSVSVDLEATASTTPNSGTLVELVVVSCSTTSLRVALEVDRQGHLLVEASPGAPAVDLGSPPSDWRTLEIMTMADALTVKLGGMTTPLTMGSSFINASGCTLTIGALAKGNIAPVTGYYSQACIY